jgi:acetolactate synthase-1/3 small subunit
VSDLVMLLLTVGVGPEKRGEVTQIVELFRGRVVDVARNSLMVQLSGTEDKLEAFVELMKPYGIKELARTGVIAMARGEQSAKEETPAPAPKSRKRSLNAAPSGPALPPS